MGFMEAPLADAPEEKLPPEGTYDLRIASKKVGMNKAETRKQISCFIVIEGAEEDYMGINHYLTFPNEDDWREEKDKAKRMLRGVNRFLHMFSVPNTPNGFDPDDLDGATARGRVGHRVGKDEDGNETSDIFPTLVLPRIDS